MKRIIIWLLLSIVFFSLEAQDKQLGKLERWYSKGHYSTTYDRAKYFLIKHDDSAEMHLYLAMSCERMLRLGTNKATDSLLLAEMIDATLTAHKLDGTHSSFKKHNKGAQRIEATLSNFLEQDHANYQALQKLAEQALKTVYGRSLKQSKVDQPKAENSLKAAKAETKPSKEATETLPAGNQLVKYAESLMGTPYKYAGCDPNGFDCSGFINYVYNHFGIKLPRSSIEMAALGKEVAPKQRQPGDLIFYGNKRGGKLQVQHVAMVHSIGEGSYYRIIHSASQGVTIDDPMGSNWDYWQDRYLFTRRVQ